MLLGKEIFPKTILVDHPENMTAVNDGDGQLGFDLT